MLANGRHHRRLGARPVDRFDADRAAMLTLPPVAPVTGWRLCTRLPRDHYVRLDANDYSVHPSVIGRRVDVAADLTKVTVTCDDRLVAQHPRCWAPRQTITDPAHRDAAAALRAARRVVEPRPATEDVQHRALTDYDRAFGLDEQVA